MASFLLSLAPPFIIFSLLFSVTVLGETHSENNYAFTENLKLIRGKEKVTHLKFYWHDIFSGPNPTVVQTVRGPGKFSATGFGSINMIDDPLTVGPELGSKLIGKAQGFYGMASQGEIGLIMAMNFAFTDGAYNGSTISVLGRNEVLAEVREMSVIGGSGVFRFARGYVEARTYKFDTKLGDATIEYNIYVLHY